MALTRIHAISDPVAVTDPEYVDGLRAALDAALDYGIAAIERGEERAPSIPAVLLIQARVAARNGISLDTVLRRYFAGYTLLGDYLIEEAENSGLVGGAELKRLLRPQATLFDRLLAAVSEEHSREADGRLDTFEQRRAERIRRLLDGELIDTSGLDYDFEAHHLGAIAKGPAAAETLRDLARCLDRRLLLVRREERVVWGWLGSRRPTELEDLQRLVTASWPRHVTLAVGAPTRGLDGWRLTHRQARAALPIALRSAQPFTRYADVAVLASILQDDLLVTSLDEFYLKPLSQTGQDGETLYETLRVYLASDRNASSAAAALGVNRQTIANRLRAVEQRVGRPLDRCWIELEAALQVGHLRADARNRQPVD